MTLAVLPVIDIFDQFNYHARFLQIPVLGSDTPIVVAVANKQPPRIRKAYFSDQIFGRM